VLSNQITNSPIRDLRDDFELRFRFPEIHALSYDSDICYLLAKPNDSQSSLIKDEGSLVINRSDPEAFREQFLALYQNNIFRKTYVSEFLILEKSLTFDDKGSQLDDKWYLRNRDRLSESDPAKIPILMPEEWIQDAKSLRRYFGRVSRRQENSETYAKPVRAPPIGLLRDPKGITQNTVNFSPVQIARPEPELNFQMVGKFGDPQSHGNLSFDNERQRK
jgi:hypothetical protein